MLGDVVHNLRAALDHAVYAFVPNPTPQTMFPIYNTDGRFEERVKQGKIAEARHEVLAHIRATRADARTHEALLALNDLDIRDKHHLIVTVHGRVNPPVIEFRPEDPSQTGWMFLDADTFALENEQKLGQPFVGKGQPIVYDDADRTIEITLGEGRRKGKPILNTVTEFADVVSAIVDGFPDSP